MGYYIDFHLQKDWDRKNGGGGVIGSCRTQIWWECPSRIFKEELAGFSQRSWDIECLAVQVCIWSDCVNDQQDFGSIVFAYQLINFFDECLLWGNWCCFKVCSILNLVVLLSLSLGASHSTTISLCYDPVVAQSRSEYHQPASKLSRTLWRRGGKRREILQLHVCLWNLNSTSNSPVAPRRLSCPISANQHEVEVNANVNKHWINTYQG